MEDEFERLLIVVEEEEGFTFNLEEANEATTDISLCLAGHFLTDKSIKGHIMKEDGGCLEEGSRIAGNINDTINVNLDVLEGLVSGDKEIIGKNHNAKGTTTLARQSLVDWTVARNVVFIAKTRKPAGLVVSVTMLADSWWAKLHGQGLLLLSLKERLVECFRHCSGQLI
ncbi:hypothetical protein JHK87_019470 [Glycine soja]|nr:hypothetical protein JHK87_019470 [Glycine soja]